jgi:toxin FitB
VVRGALPGLHVRPGCCSCRIADQYELTRRQEPNKAAELTRWVDQIEATYQVLPMSGRCFREYARLVHGHSDAFAEDAMIAATAHLHGLTVATRNERDFTHLPIAVFNPFKHRSP